MRKAKVLVRFEIIGKNDTRNHVVLHNQLVDVRDGQAMKRGPLRFYLSLITIMLLRILMRVCRAPQYGRNYGHLV